MTMRVRVSLYSALRIDRFSAAEVELPENATVEDLLETLDLPLQDIGIVMVTPTAARFNRGCSPETE